MAITDPSGTIQASLTDAARHQIARAINGEMVFRAYGFSVGRGGYDPLNPVAVLPINTAATTLIDQCFPDVTGQVPFDQLEQPLPSTVVYDCRLPSTIIPGNADYGLGEIGIWAQILTSDIPAEIGTIFLMSIAHMPIRAKTNRDAMLLRVATNF